MDEAVERLIALDPLIIFEVRLGEVGGRGKGERAGEAPPAWDVLLCRRAEKGRQRGQKRGMLWWTTLAYNPRAPRVSVQRTPGAGTTSRPPAHTPANAKTAQQPPLSAHAMYCSPHTVLISVSQPTHPSLPLAQPAPTAFMPPQVLQLPVTYRRYHKHVRAYDTADGAHLVAWGFLRPAGPPPAGPEAPRQPLLGRLKLQLYEYKRGVAGGSGHTAVPCRTRQRLCASMIGMEERAAWWRPGRKLPNHLKTAEYYTV